MFKTASRVLSLDSLVRHLSVIIVGPLFSNDYKSLNTKGYHAHAYYKVYTIISTVKGFPYVLAGIC